MHKSLFSQSNLLIFHTSTAAHIMDLDTVLEAWTGLDFPAFQAEVQLHPEYLAYSDQSGDYLSHALCQRKQFALLIDLYLVKGEIVGLYQNATGKTVLHLLATARHVDVFQSVLKHCPGALAVSDHSQRLPGHLVLDYGALFLGCLLLAQYADYFDPWLQDKEEMSFLSRFDEKFFEIQKICWERVANGDFESYSVIKAATKKALQLISAAKLRSKYRNISDIRVMKELKISILHEIALNADFTVLGALFEQEKDLCTYCDMSGMCPLMRLLACPKADIGKIQLLSTLPYVLFDATQRSLLHHILLNRVTDLPTKWQLFDLICRVLSPSDLAAAFTAIEKTGHTLLSLALLEMPIAFIQRVAWVSMGLVQTWEELYGEEKRLVEYPLVSAIKSGKRELVKLGLDSGFRLLEQPRGNSSALFTLFRVYNETVMRTCLEYCEGRREELGRDMRIYMENRLKGDTLRLSAVIEPVLSAFPLQTYSPLQLLTYCYTLQTISHEKDHSSTLFFPFPASPSPDFSLLSFSFLALISYDQSLTLSSLLKVPSISQLLSCEPSPKVLSVRCTDEVCRQSTSLFLQLFALGYTVQSDLHFQPDLDHFIDHILTTRGKSYPHILALFSLLDTSSVEGKRVIEATLIRRSAQSASVAYDLILFYTNVFRHYQSHNSVWTQVLFGLLAEDYMWGSRLVLSVLIALCKDGLVQLPMSILSQFARVTVSETEEKMPKCGHCHKVTTTEEKPLRRKTGEVRISDQRNELFFLISALEACDGELNDLLATQGYSRVTQEEILSMLIRCLKAYGASKLYFGRPYKYQDFVREWFEGLALCTCYLGASVEAKG